MYLCQKGQHELYTALSDSVRAESAATRAHQLLDDMELVCGVCGGCMVEQAGRLEALACCHLVHTGSVNCVIIWISSLSFGKGVEYYTLARGLSPRPLDHSSKWSATLTTEPL